MKLHENVLPVRQHGLTLVELVAALFVAGALIAGALSLYNSANSAQQANQMSADISAIRNALKSVQQGSYVNGTDYEAILLAMGRLPSTWNAANSSIDGTTITTYTITTAPMDNGACFTVVRSLPRVDTVSVQYGAITALAVFPATALTAAAACTGGPSPLAIVSN